MKKQEKKARSSAFQKFLKRVENLGSAYANGTQNVKQVRNRYENALNELESQASEIAKKARAALKLKEAEEKKAGKKKKDKVAAAKKQKAGKGKQDGGKAKDAEKSKSSDKKKAKKEATAKSKNAGTSAKSVKGKDKNKQQSANKKKPSNKQQNSSKKDGANKKKKQKRGWDTDGVPAVPVARRKVAADFVAETRAKRNTEPTQKDDLRLVTGIGAAIETKLNEAGIYTLQHLANASVPRLQSILDEAGGYYRRFDPKSWPNQAKRLQDAGGGRLN